MAVHQEGDLLLPRKTEKLTIRIDPIVKEALRQVSAHDNRSVANMVEVMILKRCEQLGLALPKVSKTEYPKIVSKTSSNLKLTTKGPRK